MSEAAFKYTASSAAEECFAELLKEMQVEEISDGMAKSCINTIQRYLDDAVAEQGPQSHNLKCWPESFEPIWDGTKRFEFRKNDRDFNVGDELIQREWDPGTSEYTGRVLKVRVTFISKGPQWGIPQGFAAMSISDPYDKQDLDE